MAFTIPNEADAGFVDQAKPDAVDIAILVAGQNGYGVRSGCAVTAQGPPDMTVAVASGSVVVATVVAAVAGGNVAIAAADPADPRFDLIAADNTGALSAVLGVAATNPVFPAIPADSVILAAVYVPPGAAAIAADQITDKRVEVKIIETGSLADRPPAAGNGEVYAATDTAELFVWV